jgi:response regulator RpfG family c-di-GMP phosphodiesterase
MSEKQNILVLDDDTIITNLLQTILEMANYNVVVFNNPEKALDYFLENQNYFQLAIVDFQMPKMNGIDFVKKMRTKNQQLPIMMLTAYSNPYLINNAADLNISEYIIKPFKDIKSFTASVRKNIGQENIENKMQNLYQQFVDILELVVKDQNPRGLSSINFIIKTLEMHNFEAKILEVMKKIQAYVAEQIKYLEAEESYLALKQNSESRKAEIKNCLNKLKELSVLKI